mmetsp:Transcript_41607/g.66069  ORF Transcript_41607/g.66069 Transcript_41607/m.66069 type:complete len:182 (+) Transcript_41607:116-661(+)
MVTWRPSRECLIGAGVAAAVAGSLYYIFADSDKETHRAAWGSWHAAFIRLFRGRMTGSLRALAKEFGCSDKELDEADKRNDANAAYIELIKKKQEETKASDRRLGKPSDVVRLDEDDLDPEERKLIAEVKKKGYYHGRPKSEAAPSPQRIQNHSDDCAGAESDSKRRADFDEFQKKWDRFG